jgi:hypothetical protein
MWWKIYICQLGDNISVLSLLTSSSSSSSSSSSWEQHFVETHAVVSKLRINCGGTDGHISSYMRSLSAHIPRQYCNRQQIETQLKQGKPLKQRFAGSNPSDYDGFLKAIKLRSKTSFVGKVKPSTPCRKILRHIKDPCVVWQRYFVSKINDISHQVSLCFPTRCLCWYFPESSGWWIRIY